MHVYRWSIPERAGPAAGDGSSIAWMYHSHTDEVRDTNAGLIGPILVTARGMGRDDATPLDVDRELVNLFTVYDENQSWYLAENVQTYAGEPATVDMDDDDFRESNLMHSINGYVYGNLDGLTMKVGDTEFFDLQSGTAGVVTYELDLKKIHKATAATSASAAEAHARESKAGRDVLRDVLSDNPKALAGWTYEKGTGLLVAVDGGDDVAHLPAGTGAAADGSVATGAVTLTAKPAK